MVNEQKLYITASDICLSEQKSSEIFLLVQARLLSSRANGNAQGVTPAFIDQVVANPDKYSCLPLYVDMNRLLQGDYHSLGHRYNEKTGEFGTQQCGAITSFRKQADEYGISLIAEFRIPKREEDVCACVMELYRAGQLNFSFEIKYSPDGIVQKDGVMYVDAGGGVLTSMCIVSIPAYPESTALSMVAEMNDSASAQAKGVETKMNDMEKLNEAIAESETAQAEETVVAEENAVASEMKETETAEETNGDATAEKKDEACAEEKKEDACGECKKDEANAESLAEDASAEQKPEEQATAEQAQEMSAQDESAQVCAEQADPEKEQLKAQVAQLRASLAEAQSAVAQLKQIKEEIARKQLQQDQAKAKTFAEKQGLDVTDDAVCKAISELNYKAIAEMSLAKMDVAIEIAKDDVVVASMAGDGFEIKGGKWDDLLAPAE